MNFLLLLVGFGNPVTSGSEMSQFDFNNNGEIDMGDFLHMLSLQPPITEDTTIYCSTNEKTSR